MERKAVLIVLDSVGVGALPDACEYGDTGAATLQNIVKSCLEHQFGNLKNLGLFNIAGIDLNLSANSPQAIYCRAAELSKGKDSIVGHWELMGIVTEQPFLTFPDGFPPDVVSDFEALIRRGTLGNIAASGTEIIKAFGQEHMQTGKPIIYTSADSVFQIAAHEDIIPLELLYKFCKKARDYFDRRMGVGRVIARPFTGENGIFTRTSNRHDFAAVPGGESVLEKLQKHGVPTFSVGKPLDIFASKGFDDGIGTTGNSDGIEKLIEAAKSREGLIFVNLNDFDMLYGHRRDVRGYADALSEFDRALPRIIDAVGDGLLIITADHGCDPTFKGSDHTREYIPVLICYNGVKAADMGTRETFADVGATIMHWFGFPYDGTGRSIL